jgi:hypothetical protein
LEISYFFLTEKSKSGLVAAAVGEAQIPTPLQDFQAPSTSDR